MSTSLHFFFPPVYKKSPSEGTRIRGSTLFCLRSPARPHEVLSYSVRCKGRRPGDLLSFRPSRSGMQFSHLICIRFHYPDSLCHIQKTYSFLHRSYYRQELMFNAVSVKLMECRSGNSRKDLLSFQPVKLRNALQLPIHIRSHYPDSLCCLQTLTLFFIVSLCVLYHDSKCVSTRFL